MKPLAIVGAKDTGKTRLTERLVERLADRGRVATVKHLRGRVEVDEEGTDTDRHRAAGAAETYGLMPDGAWFATGEGRSLETLLADLAPSTDYALLEGFSDAALPTVALGGREHAGETLAAAPRADAVDLDAIVAALDEREPFETLSSLVARAKDSPQAEYAGAIATFTGRVRRMDGPDDMATDHLEFEKYEEVADERLATIRSELEAREGVHEVVLHHRTGVVDAGEDIVFVVVLAGHRDEAFATVSDGIDRLKEEVPLFKKEVTVDGEFWKHDPDVDAA